MGLGVAEVIMDIEDRFSIHIHESDLQDLTVCELVQVTISKVRAVCLEDRLHAAADSYERNNLMIDRKIYNYLALKYGMMPLGFFQDAKLPNSLEEWQQEIRAKAQGVVDLSDKQIAEIVRDIIIRYADRSSINDEDHLIRDLHLD